MEKKVYYRGGIYELLLRKFIRETRPTARKEHTCCEHEDRKIAVGEKYLRIDGIWQDEDYRSDRCRKTIKICLSCEKDWNTVLEIFRNNGEDNASITYENLSDTIWEALKSKYIQRDHVLIQKWYPNVYRDFLREGMSDEEIILKEVEEAAANSGLQLAIPDL